MSLSATVCLNCAFIFMRLQSTSCYENSDCRMSASFCDKTAHVLTLQVSTFEYQRLSVINVPVI